MRRYVYRDHRNCTTPGRREIREPIPEDLGERPRNHTNHVQFPMMPMVSYDQFERLSMGNEIRIATHQYAFETVCFSTMIWIEECTDSGVSMGHYRIYNSHFQVPQGVELPTVEVVHEGQVIHDEYTEPYRGLDGEAYYRYRMYELQRQLDQLQNNRPIVTQQELSDIQRRIRAGEDKPVKVFETYFDDNIFEVE